MDRIAIEVLKKEMVKNAEIQNKQEIKQDNEILKLEEQLEEMNDLKNQFVLEAKEDEKRIKNL